jgi:hypothetical protein
VKKLILIAIYLAAFNANAGTAKLLWTHDYKGVDGTTVTITGFKFYWNINGGPFSNVLPYGPPAPIPYKVVSGMYYYAKTFDVAAWVPGTTVCFKATALAGDLESDPSGPVCKVFSVKPDEPVIVDIDKP